MIHGIMCASPVEIKFIRTVKLGNVNDRECHKMDPKLLGKINTSMKLSEHQRVTRVSLIVKYNIL